MKCFETTVANKVVKCSFQDKIIHLCYLKVNFLAGYSRSKKTINQNFTRQALKQVDFHNHTNT